MTKISLAGSGNIGSQIAFYSLLKNLGDVVLVDIVEGLPQGRALDLNHGLSFSEKDIKVVGSNEYAQTKDSDFVVITAGFIRKSGMSRANLKEKNFAVMETIVPEIAKYSPNAIIIIVTNPLDLIVGKVYDLSGFPKERIIGMGGMLDTSRFKFIISEALGVDTSEIEAFVVGPHNDLMVPLVSSCKIGGKPLTDVMDENDIKKAVERTKHSGAEMISLLKDKSAFFAPALAVVKMIEAMKNDTKKIMSCSVLLEGEYGFENVFAGVPVVLGKGGVEKIIEFEMSSEEENEFSDGINGLIALSKM